jgi:hypothetical protein
MSTPRTDTDTGRGTPLRYADGRINLWESRPLSSFKAGDDLEIPSPAIWGQLGLTPHRLYLNGEDVTCHAFALSLRVEDVAEPLPGPTKPYLIKGHGKVSLFVTEDRTFAKPNGSHARSKDGQLLTQTRQGQLEIR